MKTFKRLAISAFLLAASVGAALAQAGPGPGPGPVPDPWQLSGGSIYLPGEQCLIMPSGVTGGCKGNNTINAHAFYIDGVSIGTGPFLPLAGGTMAGTILFSPDSTYDIGASGATRPRDLFVGRNELVGGTLGVTGHVTLEGVTSTGATGTGKLVFDTAPTLGVTDATSIALGGCTIGSDAICATGTGTVSGDFTLGASSKFIFSGRSTLQSGTDGYATFQNNAGTDFSMLRLGGSTASFPGIKRNAAALDFRLADDSGYAAINSGALTVNGNGSVISGTFGLSGNISAPAWTTSGIRYKNSAATITDTTSSGTVAAAYTNAWNGNTIAATNPTTFTNYYGSYFTQPSAGANVTMTNGWAAGADSFKVNGALAATGHVTLEGVTSTGATGTGKFVFDTSPTISGLTVTGSLTATNLVANTALAQMATKTIKGNATAGTANAADLTASQVQGITEQGTTLLNVLTASSSATLSDTTSFTSTYDDYLIVIDNLVPATNSVGLNIQVQSGGSFQTTNYLNVGATSTSAVTGIAASNLSSTAGIGASVTFTLHNVNSTTTVKSLDGFGSYYSASSTVGTTQIVGFWNGGMGAVTGLQFAMSSGNIASGTIKIYGIRKAL